MKNKSSEKRVAFHNKITFIRLLLLGVLMHSCIDPVPPEFDYEDGLVIIDAIASTVPGTTYATVKKTVLEFGIYKTEFMEGCKVSLKNSVTNEEISLTEGKESYLVSADFRVDEGTEWELKVTTPADDDVISMGGTFDRLVSQGHEVHVVYQTSGNIAVSDQDALKYLEVTSDLIQLDANSVLDKLRNEFSTTNLNQPAARSVCDLKASIRKRESLGATRYFAIPDEQVHFMNLPFYETGMIAKNPISQEDIDLTVAMIEKIKPHQIYAAGDLADPHGTHRVCLDLIFAALELLKPKSFMKD